MLGSDLGDGGKEQHAAFMARLLGESRHMSRKALCFGPGKGEHDECVEAKTMILECYSLGRERTHGPVETGFLVWRKVEVESAWKV